MAGHTYKTTAVALQGRRLVAVSKRHGVWSATLTSQGEFYLKNGRHPDHATTVSVPRPAPSTTSTAIEPQSATAPKSVPARQAAPLEPTVSEAAALIRRLQSEGGELRIDDPDSETRARYRRAIHAAKQDGLVPEGHVLRHTGRSTGDIVVCLYSTATSYDTDWNRLRLGHGDARTTPKADYAALEADPTNLDVAIESVPRVISLLRALADEGAARGCQIGVNTATKHPRVFVKVGAARRALDVFEEYDKVPYVPTPQEQRAMKRRPWIVIREFDQVRSGRLRVEVGQYQSSQRGRWTDKAGKPLEQQVVQIVKQVVATTKAEEQIRVALARAQEERRAAAERAAEAAAVERRRREQEQVAQWELAMAQARVEAVETLRRTSFQEAYLSWRAAAEVREFSAALEQATAKGVGVDPELSRWLAWARATADELDPTVGASPMAGISFDPEPRPRDLRPHLGDWSPHEPVREKRSDSDEKTVARDRERVRTWHHGMVGRRRWW